MAYAVGAWSNDGPKKPFCTVTQAQYLRSSPLNPNNLALKKQRSLTSVTMIDFLEDQDVMVF